MNTCPHCGAETRPGDRFCLNCGKPLTVSNPPSQPEGEEATMLGSPLPPPNSWSVASAGSGDAGGSGSSSSGGSTSSGALANQQQSDGYEGATIMAPPNARTVENPGRFILNSYKGKEVTNGTSYSLDKATTTIGRAPENDIVLLDEEKVISRYHATVRYTNGTYTLIDNGSSNGTNVNGQPVDKQTPRTLQDADHVIIGDYELVYYAPVSTSDEATMIGISPPPNFETVTFGDQQREPDEGQTANWDWQQNAAQQGQQGQLGHQGQQAYEQTPAPAYASQYGQQPVSQAWPQGNDMSQQASVPGQFDESAPVMPPPPPSVSPTSAPTGVTVQRFNNLTHPLPDIASLINAVSALNTQVSALQGQLNTANEATQSHQTEVTETAQQLRDGMAQVSDRMNGLTNDGSQSREAVHWDQLQSLLQDVIRNPRDIDNARAFADRASDVNMVLQKYDALLNGLAECNNQLRTLIGEG
jgi:predicted component of type VI protein secretion system